MLLKSDNVYDHVYYAARLSIVVLVYDYGLGRALRAVNRVLHNESWDRNFTFCESVLFASSLLGLLQ
jgi:hypothetical protein